jgi:hypothetical protein
MDDADGDRDSKGASKDGRPTGVHGLISLWDEWRLVWQWPGLTELTAYIAAASVFTGLMFNVGFFATISWDLVGVLDTSDFVSSAIAYGYLVVGGLLGTCMLLVISISVSRIWPEPVREVLDDAPAKYPNDRAYPRLERFFNILDRNAKEPARAPSGRIYGRKVVGFTLLALVIALSVIQWLLGFISAAQLALGLLLLLALAMAVIFADHVVAPDQRIRWSAIFSAAVVLTALVAASWGAKKADEAWESGPNFVDLRSAPTGVHYRVVETFGRGVLARDAAGRAMFVPWTNVEKVTAPRR